LDLPVDLMDFLVIANSRSPVHLRSPITVTNFYAIYYLHLKLCGIWNKFSAVLHRAALCGDEESYLRMAGMAPNILI
jgi:hypothetical protein